MSDPEVAKNPIQEKLAKDRAEINEAILSTTLGWSALESNAATLLDTIINTRGLMGYAIYFAPNNAETRFEILNQAFYSFIDGTTVEDTVEPEWKLLKKQLDRSRANRNKVIHGAIGHVGTKNKTYVRLTPVMFDINRLTRQINRNQIVGMSAHDVTSVANGIWKVNKSVMLFNEIAVAIHNDDKKALQEKLLELSDHRQKKFDHR
ncbi:MAG: hypothetical protein O7A62_15690 [Alphaproteobacteria bacterium]|nr:hypothetical protein [Alphaproteobacteria bacterium]MCZ6592247.1 hypothetical protein [Alphaproteobacteria bacterium]